MTRAKCWIACLFAVAAASTAIAALPPETPQPEWSDCDGALCADVPIVAQTPSPAAFETHGNGWAGPGPFRHFTVSCPQDARIEAADFIDSDASDCARLFVHSTPFPGEGRAYFRVDFDHGACPAFHTTLRIRCR
jgi:hypothetical protein